MQDGGCGPWQIDQVEILLRHSTMHVLLRWNHSFGLLKNILTSSQRVAERE